jgi:acetate kinase
MLKNRIEPSVRMMLVLNTGSTSVKFAIYECDEKDSSAQPKQLTQLAQLARGSIDTAETPLVIRLKNADGHSDDKVALTAVATHDSAAIAHYLIDWSQRRFPNRVLQAIVHRVVHGGAHHRVAERVSNALIAELEALTPLAPLHQPANLAPIKAIGRAHPELMQIACFDTGFHRDQPKVMQMTGLPLRYFERGLRRMGFHGLSFEYVAGRVAALESRMPQRMVAAHLGGGASVCGMRDGASVSCSMGVTALDGLVMATRAGSVDPGLLLHLLDVESMSTTAMRRMLYEQSGLLGTSGISGDMRVLLASKHEAAADAVALFVQRAAREIAAITADLGGIDTLVFTGGVGEHQPPIRRAICERLAWMGVRVTQLSDANNADGEDRRIHVNDGSASVWVIHTDEESVMAAAARTLVISGNNE